MNQPILSVITPAYNRAESLETAIRSVYAQGIDALEYLIMDGGSSDSTREIVSRYPGIRFYSEPDHGLYDALNKGLSRTRGKYFAWLNSDDYFLPKSLGRLIEILERDDSLTAVFASAEIIPSSKQKAVQVPAIQPETILQRVTLDSFSFNAAVYRLAAVKELGFNNKYRIGADRDFLYRFGLAGCKYKSLNEVVYVYQSPDSSLTYGKGVETRVQANLEEMQMAEDHALENDPICRQWHTRASADAVILLAFAGKFSRAREIAHQGMQRNRSWRKVFCRLLLLAVARKVFSPEIRSHFSRFRPLLTGSR